MKSDKRIFIVVLIAIIVTLVLISFASTYLSLSNNFNIIRVVLIIISSVSIVLTISITWVIFVIYKLSKEKSISELSYKMVRKLLTFIYPLLIFISKLINSDINITRRYFAIINNLLIRSKNIKVKKDELLILLPHCLQYSECQYKITNDIHNCTMCGKCDIKNIQDLCKKYKVRAVVATGGTLAREWIKKYKPKAIIAVACERDLVSGINDVKQLPVLGVLNERPNGPCFNTKVNLVRLEEAIKNFLGEE